MAPSMFQKLPLALVIYRSASLHLGILLVHRSTALASFLFVRLGFGSELLFFFLGGSFLESTMKNLSGTLGGSFLDSSGGEFCVSFFLSGSHSSGDGFDLTSLLFELALAVGLITSGDRVAEWIPMFEETIENVRCFVV